MKDFTAFFLFLPWFYWILNETASFIFLIKRKITQAVRYGALSKCGARRPSDAKYPDRRKWRSPISITSSAAIWRTSGAQALSQPTTGCRNFNQKSKARAWFSLFKRRPCSFLYVSFRKLTNINDFFLSSFCDLKRLICTAIIAVYIRDNQICILHHPFISFRNSKLPKNLVRQKRQVCSAKSQANAQKRHLHISLESVPCAIFTRFAN